MNSGSTGQIAYYNGNGAAVSGMSTIPVSAGGTGASTAAGALAALGGVSLAATTAQNLAGPLNASVNSQINVMAYGAKGDCTTDDHNAIAAAQAAAMAFTPPAVIYFPKPPGSCYLTSAITWAGVSLIGQPTGIAVTADATGRQNGVVIKGKPGLDILHVPDPTTVAFPWNGSWAIKDITFLTDGTAVTTTYPHRWPGKWFDDTTTTNGSPIISTTNGELTAGDVGQAIQIKGAGTSVCNDGSGSNCLITTIKSVSPTWAPGGPTTWQIVTLAANAQATLSNAHTYLSLLGLPVTEHIGNCAIAMDDMDGLTSNWASPSQKYGGIGDVLENVVFSTYGRTSNPCGIYTQGGWILYQLASHHVNFEWLSYGVVQSTPELNAFQMSDAGDFEVWDHSWFFMDLYPWISYNGGGTVLSNIELSTMTGPQILQAGNVAFDTASGVRIEGVEFETVGFTPTGYGFRIDSSDNIISNASLAGPGTTAQINGHNNKCVGGCGGAALALGGSNNSIDLGGTDISTPVTDQGRGNTVLGVYSGAGAFAGMQTNYVRTLLPYKGESQISGRVTADNIADGNYSTPYNKDDLLIWPQDFIGAPSPGFNTPYSAFYIPDAASPTGAEWTLTNANLPLQYGQFTNNSLHLTVGNTLPAARATVVYMAKCLSAVGNFSLNVKPARTRCC